ncbi:MAG: GNAT family N-acetyltransferase [Pseudobdellovibrionaceae bacterium]
MSGTLPVALEGFPSFKYTALKTPNLLIRPPKRTDWQEWLDIRTRNKDHLIPFEPAWGNGWEERRHYLARVARQEKEWREDRAYAFLIFSRYTGEMLGGVNINNIARGAARFASLGYWIDQNVQGQGVMHEALEAIIRLSFTHLKLERLNAGTLAHNTRSRKLLEKCGFTEEGFAKSYVEIEGRRQDHVLYGLTKEEYIPI